jgi:hypothetical protein
MKFRFTHHAQYRLYTRIYSIQDIKHTILKPDFENRLQDGKIVSNKVSNKACNGKILRVVYVYEQNTYIILSFYYL